MKRKFLIIGLGGFGRSVLKELHNLEQEVVGCDKSIETLDELESHATFLVEGDATEDAVLEELNATDYDTILVSMGDNFEAAILIVTKLKNMGCQNIISKANDHVREQVLKAVGAKHVILPEEEAGIRLANKIAHPEILERFLLGARCEAVEVKVPKEYIGKTIIETNIRKKYKTTIILIHREGSEKPIISPEPTEVLKEGDRLLLVGEEENIEKMQKKFEE